MRKRARASQLLLIEELCNRRQLRLRFDAVTLSEDEASDLICCLISSRCDPYCRLQVRQAPPCFETAGEAS